MKHFILTVLTVGAVFMASCTKEEKMIPTGKGNAEGTLVTFFSQDARQDVKIHIANKELRTCGESYGPHYELNPNYCVQLKDGYYPFEARTSTGTVLSKGMIVIEGEKVSEEMEFGGGFIDHNPALKLARIKLLF